jgi:endonuclease YncB( thermonuclease family)
MSKAIEELRSGMKVGHVALGLYGAKQGTIKQQVHDGDTITVRALGNFGTRFLGIDAAEISGQLPGHSGFIDLKDPRWEAFLKDPLVGFQLSPGLTKYLQGRIGPGVAMNHYNHALAAKDALVKEVQADLKEMGKSEAEFEFFMVFANEIMDRYGRLLGYLNRNQPTGDRPLTYNERLLRDALVCPYFIWPNVNPFKKAGSLIEAVIKPGHAADTADSDKTLRMAREWMSEARKQNKGIFDAKEPLKLEPFELRYLAGQRAPNRWVIDLSKNSSTLIAPENYYTVPHAEDRLFIPEEYVPLFVEIGWKRQK